MAEAGAACTSAMTSLQAAGAGAGCESHQMLKSKTAGPCWGCHDGGQKDHEVKGGRLDCLALRPAQGWQGGLLTCSLRFKRGQLILRRA